MHPARSRARDPSDDGLARSRVRFLTAESVEPSQVRDTILASWRRSRRGNVAADRVHLPYIRDPNLDTPLSRSAQPVLVHLREQLAGQPISVVLTDRAGLVLARLTGDADLERHLDSVQLAPGFSYAEEFVGTNGIGTALEDGAPRYVFGHEHYAENLEDLACAGVPIQHPISGKTIGAIDLTCWRKDAGPLLVTLAKTTAVQIRQALLADAGSREIELLHEYLRACRRTPGIVFALNDDVVMMNDYARTVLAPGDQAALLRQATEAFDGQHRAMLIELPSGATVRMHARPLGIDRRAGGVVHAKLVEVGTTKTEDSGSVGRTHLRGLVGSSSQWLRACEEVDNACRSMEWLALEGEAGVGKLAILRAVHQRRNPCGHFSVLDAAEATDQRWLSAARGALASGEGDNPGTLVIRHLDRLNGSRLQSLSAALQEARSNDGPPPWVAVTFGPGAKNKGFARLLRFFPSTVEVPPLRYHVEDLRQLVPFFLARLGDRLTCSPETLQLLMRSSWSGNIEQLCQLLRQVVRHRRSGAIQPSDLPPDSLSVSRRLLSPLESMERDAIVRSLLDAQGNKGKAARSLGMSRATIYRKIHEFGIVSPLR